MGSKIKLAVVNSLVGGFNSFNNATQVKDNESPDLLNVVFAGLTGISKRQGYIKLSAEVVAGKKITGIFSYVTNSVREILYVCNSKLYKLSGSSSIEVTGGTFSTTNVNAIQLGTRLYLFDGVTALQYYNGTNIVTTGISAAPTKVNQGIKFNNRLYCTSNDQKSRVYFGKPLQADGTATDTGDFTSSIVSTLLNGALAATATSITVDSTTGFPATGNIVIDSEIISYTGIDATTFTGCTRGAFGTTNIAHDDNAKLQTTSHGGYVDFGLGVEVTGFGKSGTSLYVFLKNGIKSLSPQVTAGVLDHSSSIISNSIGCRAPRSIENVENDIYFMSDTIYSLGEIATYSTIRTTNVSARVSKLFAGMTQTAIANVACIYYDREETFIVAFQSGTACNDHILAYQIPYKAWTYWDSVKVNSWLDWIDSTDTKHLYYVSDDSTNSYIYELYQGLSDDGVAVLANYKTKEYDLKEFNIEKIYQNWNLQLGGVYGILTVNLYANGVVADTISFSSGSGATTSDGLGTLPMGTFLLGLEGNFTDATSTGITLSNDWRWHTLVTSPNGTTFQMEFINNNLNESFEVKQASVGYLPLPYHKRDALKEV
jgi:hypothetical protein